MFTRRNFMGTLPLLAGMSGAMATNAADKPETTAAPDQPGQPSAEWARHAALPPEQHREIRQQVKKRRALDPRPNILLLFTDQQTFNAMRCAGNPYLRTPNMNFLARRGVRFERCYCPSPVCSPSRASMLSGRLPHETGVRYNNLAPHAQLPLLGHVLRDAGYDTTWSGKWHLPSSYPKENEIQGFHCLTKPEDLQGGFLGAATDMHFAQCAGRYLRWHAGLSAKPWFLGVSLHNPHDICHYFVPKSSHLSVRELEPDREDAAALPPLPPNFAKAENEPEMLQRRRSEGEMGKMPYLSDTHWRCYLQSYYHLTQEVDRCLAPILDGLDAGGWLDNTLLVFTSDHGEGVACHQFFTKLACYEQIMRVPFIAVPPRRMRDPGAGRVDNRLVSLLDFMPTVLDYAGIPAGNRPLQRGCSLRPLLDEPSAKLDREFVVTHLDPNPNREHESARMLVTDNGWKYCRYNKGARPEQLFDLNSDPGEMCNLVHDEPHQKQRLAALLKTWCQSVDDPFVEVL